MMTKGMSNKSARQTYLVLGKGLIADEMLKMMTKVMSCKSARQRYLVLSKGFIADEMLK